MTKRLLLLVALVLAVGLPLAYAQKGVGKVYGARDPQSCDSRKAPAKGALSAAQAAQYFACDKEGERSHLLYLVTDVKAEVAKGRPFNIRTDSMPDIDPSELVYNIRGSFIMYQCSSLDGHSLGKPGKNCSAYDETKAVGICYKNTFGDWHCGMNDDAAVTNYRLIRRGLPPPE